jgi:hypothetical protein
MLELISSGLDHKGPSPPPHARIEGNPSISGQWAPMPMTINRACEPKFACLSENT